MVGTADPAKATAFYDAVLGALGVPAGQGGFYSHKGLHFGVGKPRNGEPATAANGGTIGFAAANKEQVDAFYAQGLAHGGTCEGPAGPRPKAPGNAYGAYLRDPDGNKICAFCDLGDDGKKE